MKVTVSRPHPSEREEIFALISTVVRDTMIRDGAGDKEAFIVGELERQQNCLDADFHSNGREAYYLRAKTEDGRIVGSIALVPANSVIRANLEIDSVNTPELGNVLVHPDSHGRGVGAAMVRAALLQLRRRKQAEFVLDCGYQVSQGYWKRHFGEPDVYLTDYYGPGIGHMIWKRRVDDYLNAPD